MTTDSIPLSDLGLPPGDDGLRRDRWGRLMVVPPGQRGAVGYTRVTTVAKALDEGGGLAPWKAAMSVTGTMLRPGIRAKWEALISETNGNPWYASPEAKAKCKQLVEEAAAAGGAIDRRDQGTALHAILAHLDEGEHLGPLTPQTQRDVEAYVNCLIEAGVTMRPEYVEATVVLDEHRVGGSFDGLANVDGYALPMIADRKTGEELTYSWAPFAVQLAAYSRANSIYVQGADPNGGEDMRDPMPDVDQHHGLIIHLPAGSGRCELHVVDLDAGWAGFDLSLRARAWRARKGLHTTLAEAQPVHEPTVATSMGRHPSGLHPRSTEATDRTALRVWLQERIDICGQYPAARADLGRSWPPGVPALKSSTEHGADVLATIEAVLNGVEARHSIPFWATGPGQQRTEGDVVGQLLQMFPNSTIHEETPS